MEIVAFLIFAAIGFTFGYALAGPVAYLAFLPPVLLFLGGLVAEGFEGPALLEFVIALAITLVALLAGRALASREGPREQATT